MLKKGKIFLAPLIILMSFLCAHTVFAEDIRVFYNGSEIFFDVPPQIINDRTMVPVRAAIEAITDSPMEWDPNTKTVTFHANGHTNRHTIGTTLVYVDGVPISFDTPSLIINSRTLVPIRMIAETTGCKVDWDGNSRYVIITSQPGYQTGGTPAITSFVANKTSITAGEAIEFTVRTNSAVNSVWADDGFGNVAATYRSVDASGIKAWTFTVSPSSSRIYTVYANTTQSISGAAKQSISITVNQVSARITSISTNRSSISRDESVTFTIRTNSGAEYVWLEYDNKYTNASYQSISGDTETWTATIYPYETQYVRVYAHASSRTASGADYQSQRITVNEGTIEITSASLSADTINSGDSVTATVRTSTSVTYVYLETGSYYGNMRLDSTGSSSKTWTLTFSPAASGNVKIYAGGSSGSSEVSKTLYITVNEYGGNPAILDSYASPATVSVLPSVETANEFVVITNSDVEQIVITDWLNQKHTINSSVLVSMGNKRWTTTLNMKTDGNTTGYFNVRIDAYDAYGYYVTDTVRIYIES